MSKIVTIIWRFLPQYRYDFFNKLKQQLNDMDIILYFVYGKNNFVPRKDEVDIEWGIAVQNKVFCIGKYFFYWQPIRF